MHIDTLKVFCDVVETTSFSAAAERSGITQSAVSQKLRNLEQSYGVVMIERGAGRPFRLTPEGEAFYAACREIMATFESVPGRLLKAQGDLTGEVRVACVPSLGLHELAEARRKFRRTYPGVRVTVVYADWEGTYAAVAAGDADLGLVAHPEPRPGLEIEPCWQDKLVLVCPLKHRLARYGTVGLRDLRDERFVMCHPDAATARAIGRVFERAKVEIRILFEVANTESALRAVEVEGVLTILPAPQAPDRPDSFRIVEVNSAELWRPVGLARPTGAVMAPPAREFARALREWRG
jgi:LysR family transcriptional regulator, transcriptional activator of the cysJI operon